MQAPTGRAWPIESTFCLFCCNASSMPALIGRLPSSSSGAVGDSRKWWSGRGYSTFLGQWFLARDRDWSGGDAGRRIARAVGLDRHKDRLQQTEYGSCTVLLDGVPMLSCTLPALKAAGKHVTTVEGLARDGQLHPLQGAFVQFGAVQCGFCIPGQLMMGAALLSEHTNPTEDQIREAFKDTLCRCGGLLGYDPRCPERYPEDQHRRTNQSSKNGLAGARQTLSGTMWSGQTRLRQGHRGCQIH